MDALNRVCTGIDGLDTQLGGGVPPGTSILIIADSTNALYRFLDEIAAFGAQQDQDIFWFELDRPRGLMERSLNGAFEGHEDKIKILDAYQPRGAVSRNGSTPFDFQDVDPLAVPDMVTDTLSAAEPGAYRLLFTSLSTLLQTLDPDEVLAFVRHVVALGEDLGGLQIFTLIKNAHPPEEVAMLKHVFTGVFELGMERKGFGLYSYLKIIKLLGVSDAAKLMLFNETDEGLRLESTKRVF